MLHHGPNHEHLVVRPVGGLGNRMLAVLAAAHKVANDYYKSMTIIWSITHHCSISIESFISIDLDHDITYDTSIIEGRKQYEMYKGFKFDAMIASNLFLMPGETGDDVISWAKQTDIIKYNIKDARFKADLGLHCRRSDWGLTCGDKPPVEEYEVLHTTLDESFYDFIQDKIMPSTFIASDSYKSIDYISTKIPNLKYFNKSAGYRYSSHRNAVMMEEAINDLSELAHCQTIIRDSGSTFPLLASIIGKNKLITWERPVLKACGPGEPDYHIK